MTFSAEQAWEIVKEAGFDSFTREAIRTYHEKTFLRAFNLVAAMALEDLAARFNGVSDRRLQDYANEYRTAAQPPIPEFLRKTT